MKGRYSCLVAVALTLILCGSARAIQSIDFDAIARRVNDNLATTVDADQLIALVAREPGNVRANLVLAQLLEAQGFDQIAIEALDRAIAAQPDCGEAHYRRCLLLIRQNDVASFEKDVKEAERLLDKDGDKLFQLGLTLERHGKREDAKRLFQKAALAGHKGEGYGANLAQIRLSQGKLNEALEAIEWDLKSNPDDIRAILVKGNILERMGDQQSAINCFVTAARRSPCQHSAAEFATTKLIEAKRYDDALATALLDLLCFKRDAQAMERSKLLVMDLMQRVADRKTQNAIVERTSSLVEKSRRCRYFRLALGDIYDRMKQTSKAMEQYQLALHSCPAALSDRLTEARGFFRLGRDYELALRNHREALDCYRRARLLAPQDQEINANYLRLKRRMDNRKNDYAWRIKDAWYSFWRVLSPLPPS